MPHLPCWLPQSFFWCLLSVKVHMVLPLSGQTGDTGPQGVFDGHTFSIQKEAG